MNPLQSLLASVNHAFSGARTALDPAERPGGSWFLDVRLDDYVLSVEWKPYCGLGVTAGPEPGYGAGPDEVFPDLASAEERVLELIRSRGMTGSTAAVTIETLRKARGMTQSDLARRLGKPQAAIAQVESRSDVRVSTLAEVVAAMGGRLTLRATFPDGTERELRIGGRSGAGRRSSRTRKSGR